MKRNYRISCAVAGILAAHAAAPAFAQRSDAPAAASEPGTGISEVIVTAQRRAESSQDVPITLQALTSETIAQLNVTTLDDFVKYLPNVTWGGNGPGQGEIYMRGLSTGQSGEQGSGSLGSFPNVAIYLDEQSGQLPGRNLDIYAADMERIEILEGPQGTLFGAGAEAGVVRYITNKPKLDVTTGTVNAGYGTTAHGDPVGPRSSAPHPVWLAGRTPKVASQGNAGNASGNDRHNSHPGQLFHDQIQKARLHWVRRRSPYQPFPPERHSPRVSNHFLAVPTHFFTSLRSSPVRDHIKQAAVTHAVGLREVRPLCFGVSVARLCGVKVSHTGQTPFCGRRIFKPMSQRYGERQKDTRLYSPIPHPT